MPKKWRSKVKVIQSHWMQTDLACFLLCICMYVCSTRLAWLPSVIPRVLSPPPRLWCPSTHLLCAGLQEPSCPPYPHSLLCHWVLDTKPLPARSHLWLSQAGTLYLQQPVDDTQHLDPVPEYNVTDRTLNQLQNGDFSEINVTHSILDPVPEYTVDGEGSKHITYNMVIIP